MSGASISFESWERQQKLQLNKVQEMLLYLHKHSPFYQQHLSSYSHSPIYSLGDLQHFPTTNKEMMQRNNWDFLCVPKPAIAEYTATSGTLGLPVTIALTDRDLERLAYNEELSFRIAGVESGDVVQLLLTLDKQFMAGMAYYSGLRNIKAGIVRTGPGMPTQQLKIAKEYNCTTWVAVPSFLAKMLNNDAWMEEMKDLPVKRIVAIGEPLRQGDFALNALGSKIHSSWNVSLHSTYASTEMQTAFTECEAGKGGHVPAELIVVEILDEMGRQVEAGVVGEVTITTLGVEGMPLFRYRTGDMAAMFTEACSCGRNSPRVGPVVGRKQQMVKLKGTTIYPPAIMDILHQLPMIRNYVVEIRKDDLQNDKVQVLIDSEVAESTCRKWLIELFQERLRVVPEFIFCSTDEISQLQLVEGSRKPIRIIDNRY